MSRGNMGHGKKVWYLIKFCENRDFAAQFIEGNLYMNRLSFFKNDKNEDEHSKGRADSNEAVAHWWQPEDLIIKLNIHGIGEVTITNEDLAAPVTAGSDFHNHWHIFCMYAMWTDGFECIDGRIDYAKEDAEKLKAQLMIDERCFQLGEYAVVVPAVQFINRVKIACKEKQRRIKLVDYFDGEKFNGSIDEVEIPFSKLDIFSYQKEFRICIDNQTKGDDPYILELGSIKEFSAIVKSSDLNALFKINEIEI